jgi:pseudouridine-5'-phosphate glycosidase
VAATLERLETLSVPVLGYRTDRFPGFYLTESDHPVTWRVDSPEEVAAVMAAQYELGIDAAIVVGNPLPAEDQLDPALHDRTLRSGLEAAERDRVTGKDVTPFLLEHFRVETSGASLEANVGLVTRNARLAAQIAAVGAAP